MEQTYEFNHNTGNWSNYQGKNHHHIRNHYYWGWYRKRTIGEWNTAEWKLKMQNCSLVVEKWNLIYKKSKITKLKKYPELKNTRDWKIPARWITLLLHLKLPAVIPICNLSKVHFIHKLSLIIHSFVAPIFTYFINIEKLWRCHSPLKWII